MNSVLNNGNTLYTAYIDEYMNGVPQFLAHDQLHILHHISVQDVVLEPTIQSDIFYGTIGFDPDVDSLAATLDSALETALQISNSILITVNEITIAVVVQDGQIYLFDSHQNGRDRLGHTCSFGTSVLLHFKSLQDLIAYLLGMYTGQMFNVSPVQFVFQANDMTQSDQHNTLKDSLGGNTQLMFGKT